jgi:LPS export ABC transporter protein LptC
VRPYLAIAVLLAVAGAYLALRGLRTPPPEAAAETEALPRYAITHAEWVQLGPNGEPEFRARAASIDYFADESIRLRDLELDTLGGAASPWSVRAPSGSAPPHERRMLLTGGVEAEGRVAGDMPVDFRSERLWVDLLRRELYTDGPVEMHTDLRTARARGLRADFGGERVQLLNDVQVDYVPEG